MRLALIIVVLVLIFMQFIRPTKVEYIENSPYELKTDENVMQIFRKACYDCHSNEVKYPWYSDIAPFSWMIANHTNQGLSALNFSLWEKYNTLEKQDKAKAIFRTAHSAMPLPAYTLVHKDANLTKEEREVIRAWAKGRRN